MDFLTAILEAVSVSMKSEDDLFREIDYLVDHRDRYTDKEFKDEMYKYWTTYAYAVKHRKK